MPRRPGLRVEREVHAVDREELRRWRQQPAGRNVEEPVRARQHVQRIEPRIHAQPARRRRRRRQVADGPERVQDVLNLRLRRLEWLKPRLPNPTRPLKGIGHTGPDSAFVDHLVTTSDVSIEGAGLYWSARIPPPLKSRATRALALGSGSARSRHERFCPRLVPHEVRSSLHARQQVGFAMVLKEIGNVALRREIRQRDNPHVQAGRPALSRHVVRVPATRPVVVREDNHPPAAGGLQLVPVLRPPLPGAASICCRRQTEPPQPIAVLLAFAVENGRMPLQLWQPVDDASRVTEFVDPAAGPVRPALNEVLRLVPHRLVQQGPGLVPVVVPATIRLVWWPFPLPLPLRGSNRSRASRPSFESTDSVGQLAKHFNSTWPSAPWSIDSEAFRSSCAGHRASQPPEAFGFTPSSFVRTQSTGPLVATLTRAPQWYIHVVVPCSPGRPPLQRLPAACCTRIPFTGSSTTPAASSNRPAVPARGRHSRNGAPVARARSTRVPPPRATAPRADGEPEPVIGVSCIAETLPKRV